MSSSGHRLFMDVMKLMWDYNSNSAVDAKMKNLNVDLHGPKDSLYQGWVWKVALVLPDEIDYPNNPPTIRFTKKIYHPNIDEESGLVSLNVINQAWSPTFGLLNVFEVFLPQLLLSPNPSDQLNEEAAALMMSDLPAYERRVKEYCEKYAKPED